MSQRGRGAYSDIHALLSDGLQAAHDVLLHLDELRQLLSQVGAEGASGIATESMAWIQSAGGTRVVVSLQEGAAHQTKHICIGYVPKLLLPKNRPDLVDEAGGGAF